MSEKLTKSRTQKVVFFKGEPVVIVIEVDEDYNPTVVGLKTMNELSTEQIDKLTKELTGGASSGTFEVVAINDGFK